MLPRQTKSTANRGSCAMQVPRVAPGPVRRCRPRLARRGGARNNSRRPDTGCRSPAALRRAIAMGFNIDELIRVLFAGNALPANQLLPPGVNGHDPSLPPKSLYDPAAPRARCSTASASRTSTATATAKRPTASRSTVVRGTLPESWYREADTLWRKNMDAIGIRMQVNQQTFAELLNLSRAGQAADVQPGLPLARAVRLPDPADALGQGNARHQSVRLQASRVRRRVRSSSCARRRVPSAPRSRARCPTSRRPGCR